MANRITPESIEAAENLLADIKAKAQAAHDAEDVFMMGLFTDVLAVVSPIVTKSIARAHREARAAINADHKALRAKMRESKA